MQDKKVTQRLEAAIFLTSAVVYVPSQCFLSPMGNPLSKDDLLSSLSRITSMERGTLTEDFVLRAGKNGREPQRFGPYYKLQIWEQGANQSRRVPPEELPLLRTDLQNGQVFDQLVGQLAQSLIADSRQQRASSLNASSEALQDSKKNSRPNASRKPTKRLKPSSPKPKQGLKTKVSKR